MSEGDRPSRQWVRWLLLAITVALLAMFARSVDWARAWDAIVHADPVLLGVATAANLASLAVKGVRWWLFLDPAGVPGVGQAVRATLAGAALNNVLIGANGGDAARVAAHGATRKRLVRGVATVAIDRLCDLVTYGVLFAFAALALPLPAELARWRIPGLVTLGVVAVVGAVLVWRSSMGDTGRPDDPTDNDAPMLSRAGRYWRRLVETSASVATAPRIAVAIVLSLVAWAGQWATFHYAAHAAAFPITPSDSLLALLVVNASFLVRLTPGNVGVFQLLYALAATAAGLDRNAAVAVSFLIQLIQYVPVTLVGLLLAPSLVKRNA